MTIRGASIRRGFNICLSRREADPLDLGTSAPQRASVTNALPIMRERARGRAHAEDIGDWRECASGDGPGAGGRPGATAAFLSLDGVTRRWAGQGGGAKTGLALPRGPRQAFLTAGAT